MSTQRLPILLALGVAVLSMTGCSDRIGMAEQAMTDIRKQPAQPIDPPPKAELVEDFVYSASAQRSPFLPPSLVNVQGPTTSIDGVRPDINRIKEPLEQYELSQLVFRGVVISPEGQRYALIQRPDGSVASVKVGDYLGINDGRIVEITPTQINLIEIVPDSRAGFVEKPQSLVSPIS
ncbi:MULTISPECIES: pilus assembly protein PilP [unclassified Psychrobacter]|uniref:pilus assembly protein PilP n=1 Tax=unclassified Psychrobacter TaxID=196806 RepID=UPI0025B3F33D|nr:MULTISPECIES: pilus assembly protein PilP [unclassified Psychrobacter]MDN3452800.1 pilus assembly protein PilP [Psychrobacter sp. APC 3350]MDN3503347.1 pilus assembly protein PilP [Psychrobacter sp. 5A.1]